MSFVQSKWPERNIYSIFFFSVVLYNFGVQRLARQVEQEIPVGPHRLRYESVFPRLERCILLVEHPSSRRCYADTILEWYLSRRESPSCICDPLQEKTILHMIFEYRGTMLIKFLEYSFRGIRHIRIKARIIQNIFIQFAVTICKKLIVKNIGMLSF